MTVEIVTQIQSGILTAVFITDATAEAAKAALPAQAAAAFDWNEKTWEASAVSRHLSRETNFILYGLGKAAELNPEKLRLALHSFFSEANGHKAGTVQIVFHLPAGSPSAEYYAMALGEMPVLSGYEFNIYKSEVKQPKTVKEVKVFTDVPGAEALIKTGKETAEYTCIARDLVNEPPNVLTPVTLAERAVTLAKEAGIKAEVWDKKKIEEMKMGGLLAVNMGSQIPPTFTVLEYKPDGAPNAGNPIVLVGKGITFDTGGLSLKPTPGSMDAMKSDMAGAAAVICAIGAAAKAKLNLHIVSLIPSTDNRPGENAYTPNDVIKMMSGATVEVLNTDAEGRMILADALHYAGTLNPKLVIDLATLTGAAIVAVGTIASALMIKADDAVRQQLLTAGFNTYERLAELPLWDEYDDQIKSDIADMKNIGGKNAGSITAGKFLQRFTSYPWAHIDIAGPSFLDSPDKYRPKNGTGVGVRLLFDFLRNFK